MSWGVEEVVGEREVWGGWGVVGGGVGCCGACVGRVWGAIRVGIARSALLSGYLGKSGHLPRSDETCRYFGALWHSTNDDEL